MTDVRAAFPAGSWATCHSTCVVTEGASPLSFGGAAGPSGAVGGVCLAGASGFSLTSRLNQLMGFCSLLELGG